MIAFSIIFLGSAYYWTERHKFAKGFWPFLDISFITITALLIYGFAGSFISN